MCSWILKEVSNEEKSACFTSRSHASRVHRTSPGRCADGDVRRQRGAQQRGFHQRRLARDVERYERRGDAGRSSRQREEAVGHRVQLQRRPLRHDADRRRLSSAASLDDQPPDPDQSRHRRPARRPRRDHRRPGRPGDLDRRPRLPAVHQRALRGARAGGRPGRRGEHLHDRHGDRGRDARREDWSVLRFDRLRAGRNPLHVRVGIRRAGESAADAQSRQRRGPVLRDDRPRLRSARDPEDGRSHLRRNRRLGQRLQGRSGDRRRDLRRKHGPEFRRRFRLPPGRRSRRGIELRLSRRRSGSG